MIKSFHFVCFCLLLYPDALELPFCNTSLCTTFILTV